MRLAFMQSSGARALTRKSWRGENGGMISGGEGRGLQREGEGKERGKHLREGGRASYEGGCEGRGSGCRTLAAAGW